MMRSASVRSLGTLLDSRLRENDGSFAKVSLNLARVVRPCLGSISFSRPFHQEPYETCHEESDHNRYQNWDHVATFTPRRCSYVAQRTRVGACSDAPNANSLRT